MANANNVLIYYNGSPNASLRDLVNKLAGEGYRAQYRTPNLFGSPETCAKAVVIGHNADIEKAYARVNIPCEVVTLDADGGNTSPVPAREVDSNKGVETTKEAAPAKEEADHVLLKEEDKDRVRRERNMAPPTRPIDTDSPRPPPAAAGR